jgi:type I restriction enzyme S subunit
MTELTQKNPKLRFPEFNENWRKMRIKDVTDRVSIPVDVETRQLYTQIGVRSHGKGLFHKEPVAGRELGNKRVFWVQEDLFIVNIVFAWEQAVAKTTKDELGTIASHRFPMLKPEADLLNLDFLLFSFLTRRGKSLLELASPGGAGRNKTLGQEEFNRTKINLPCVEEQNKIAAFLSAVVQKIGQLTRKKELLLKYKKGVMQQIFDQKVRFKDDKGTNFPDWEVKKLADVFGISAGKSKSMHISESGQNIIVDMGGISSDGKLIADKRTQVATDFLTTDDLVMPKDDIGKGAIIGKVVNIPINKRYVLGDHVYRLSLRIGDIVYLKYAINSARVNRELRKKANGTAQIGLNRASVTEQVIGFPVIEEQTKISVFLSAIDNKAELIDQQLKTMKAFKKGLLEQMFV